MEEDNSLNQIMKEIMLVFWVIDEQLYVCFLHIANVCKVS